MSQHTPGPWEIHDGGDQGPSVCAMNPDGTCSPLVEFCGGAGRVLANARLIAAAPALLEAAKALIDELNIHGDAMRDYFNVPFLRAAIRAAQGEE